MEREKVLITGGAGFLGINLVRHLMARGYEISSLDIEKFDYPDRDRIETLKGDIRDKALVNRAMEGVDLVVHTAAALPLYSPEDIHTTDVEGTRNVLEAARRHGVERVVHVSSTAVYGIPDHHPLYETDKLEGVGPYGQAKIQAEMVCLEYRAKGLTVPIIRPKSFVGPERLGVFALFYHLAHTGDGLQRLLRLHREGAEAAGLRAEVLEQGGTTQKLPLVPGQPQPVRERLGRLSPGAVEAGRHRAAQAFLLGRSEVV